MIPDQIDAMMRDAVTGKIFPGGALLFSRAGEVLFDRVYGIADIADGKPVTHKTFFDLASLTKPLATTLAVMKLIQQGRLDLDRKISAVIPEFSDTEKSDIHVRHLLCHQSGLADYRPYYLEIGKLPFHDRPAAVQQCLVREPLFSAPGRQTRYSDIGFMILKWVIEAVAGAPLDTFIREHVYQPLGIDGLFFIPTKNPDPGLSDIEFAATENCPWRGYTVKGAVHDENAFVIGGVAGQAGLFGTAASVHRLLAALLAAHGENEKNAANAPPRQASASHPVLDPVLVKIFFKQQGSSGRALGFDMPSAAGSSSGDFFNRAHTVGHLGFTGTSFWMDLRRSIIIVFLTNRIHPSRANENIRGFRPRIHNAVMQYMHQAAMEA
jgi:serine-type D-Ala-D-Ala carboxypeptidase